ncbi:MAG TPA: sigma-70 family RNA polymerase sigma factor [Kofleriaceae bacterium]|nr:sigma-70 family RNA polymerase sigma factor [Kofleriaceae bacterium]
MTIFADADEALYARLCAGDLAAFDRLYARYERPLFGFALGQLGDRHEAEDVIHETFLALLDARRTRTELRSFKAWLFQVARHLCLNRVRSRKRGERALAAVAETTLDAAPLDDAPDAAALHGAVARLPPTLSAVYQLRASGLSYEEVAGVLEIPVGTVKSRMHELIRRLRQEMQS